MRSVSVLPGRHHRDLKREYSVGTGDGGSGNQPQAGCSAELDIYFFNGKLSHIKENLQKGSQVCSGEAGLLRQKGEFCRAGYFFLPGKGHL